MPSTPGVKFQACEECSKDSQQPKIRRSCYPINSNSRLRSVCHSRVDRQFWRSYSSLLELNSLRWYILVVIWSHDDGVNV